MKDIHTYDSCHTNLKILGMNLLMGEMTMVGPSTKGKGIHITC